MLLKFTSAADEKPAAIDRCGEDLAEHTQERLNKLLKRGWFLPLPLGGCEAWRAQALSPTFSQREREKDFKLFRI